MTSISSFYFLISENHKTFSSGFLNKKARIKRISSFGFWKSFKQLLAFMKEPAINWQFRVCPLTWFSNFLEHCLRVKAGSISYSTSEGSESVLWFLRMAIQWYTYTLLLPVGSKFQKEGTNMSFEFIKICWFQFFYFFRITRYSSLEQIRIKELSVLVISNPLENWWGFSCKSQQ
jgi:hypothetical protein